MQFGGCNFFLLCYNKDIVIKQSEMNMTKLRQELHFNSENYGADAATSAFLLFIFK